MAYRDSEVVDKLVTAVDRVKCKRAGRLVRVKPAPTPDSNLPLPNFTITPSVLVPPNPFVVLTDYNHPTAPKQTNLAHMFTTKHATSSTSPQ